MIPLPTAQVGRAAELLAEVFSDDPMMRYFVADETRMLDKPLRFNRACIRMGLRYGVVDVTPSFDGLAVWIRPGQTDFSMGQMLRTGMLTATLAMGPTTVRRFITSQGPVERARKRAMPGRHWYRMFLGVAPSSQGRGIGGELIAPGLQRADADGVPCFLDTLNERNLTFYQRHGFFVAAEGQIPGGPRFWAMRRDPPGHIGG